MTTGTPTRITVGIYRGVRIDVAAWDAVAARLDLTCAGMFAHEVGGAPLQGGLLDLDTALGGRLRKIRAGGIFKADRLETSLMDGLPDAIRSRRLLMIGMGSPDDWTPSVMRQVAKVAILEAAKLGVRSTGIAPGMLDSGLTGDRLGGAAEAMLEGVTDGIDAGLGLVDLGLSTGWTVEEWTFGTGVPRLEETAELFRSCLSAL